MKNTEILDIQRIFTTRLDALEHILSVGENNVSNINAALDERLHSDMLPLGTQIAFACNQPHGFARWCCGLPTENLNPEVTSINSARSYISNTKLLLACIKCDDSKLDEIKRTDLGHALYCETTARLYVSDYLIPNFYFHITTTYAILRKLGVPLGKADYMRFLMPHVRES